MSDTMPTCGTADSILERLPSGRPTPQQFAWQDLELGVFVHFGLYAVTGRFTGITWIPVTTSDEIRAPFCLGHGLPLLEYTTSRRLTACPP